MNVFFKLYRRFLSPLIHGISVTFSGNPHSGCKFIPTCSEYSEQAMVKYGFFKGFVMTVKRIGRCHPLSRSGGHDPV